MCGKCDNQEGNLCNACEREVQEVKAEVSAGDGWWAMMSARRSINIASMSNEGPSEMLYV